MFRTILLRSGMALFCLGIALTSGETRAGMITYTINNPDYGDEWTGSLDVDLTDPICQPYPLAITRITATGLHGETSMGPGFCRLYPGTGILWQEDAFFDYKEVGFASSDLETVAASGGRWGDILSAATFNLDPIYESYFLDPTFSRSVYLYESYGGTLTFESAPGPLPTGGAAVVFGFSRKLRRRIKSAL
jgi:hypothetical protein